MIWIIIGVVFLALILFGIFYDDRGKCFEEKSGFGLVDEKGCHGVDCIECFDCPYYMCGINKWRDE